MTILRWWWHKMEVACAGEFTFTEGNNAFNEQSGNNPETALNAACILTDAILIALSGQRATERHVDLMIARSLGLTLNNAFLGRESLVADVDNEWVVVTGDEWPPLPCYTRSTDHAVSAAARLHPGALVNIAQVGESQFRASLHWQGRSYLGSIWPSRPFAVLGAAYEAIRASH